MAAPAAIEELVKRFELHRASYVSPRYNETQLRREFVDPFFRALGWDVDNESGYAEAYKDVIHEDAIKVGGTTKAPDYCFRIGGTRKFFVETKKPSVNLKDDIAPAFQLRRYAWTAKLPLSILTDFEELAVYDCLAHRPNQTDKPSKARVLYFKYTEYADRWDEIKSLFSREAILKGSFDKYAETQMRKGGTAEVDAEFLREIETWREILAKNLALRNNLSQRELNFAVQRTIDRIVFLRICEDRGIEPTGRLQLLLNGPKVYARLGQLFEQADDRYNSGLFHFHKDRDRPEPPDELTLSLTIDDAPLKQIIRNLYYPDSPYEFSVLPADILGQVYEQFLGKIIRLTSGQHQARVEDKPEVKKAGGVFYTPTYVVQYIVDETVAKLLEGKTPQQAAKLRILDPACGSGSFLIEAYQELLDWHRDYYVNHDPTKFPKQVFQAMGSGWRLGTAERKRILLNGIYGVDIDAQAVEVTKMSLLLKVLEGESQESLNRQLHLFKQRALPDLGANIKCGNSLVGPDFFNGHQTSLFGEEDVLRINAFDWTAEFPAIMPAGGFDAVIGNPPYVRMEVFKELKPYLRRSYACHAERTDLYVYFIEREHALLREGGRLGMIVSNKFIRAKYGEPLRKYLASAAQIERIVDLAGLPVFRGATVRTIVMLTRKGNRTGRVASVEYSPPPSKRQLLHVVAGTRTLADIVDPLAYKIPERELGAAGWRLIRPEHAALMDQLAVNAVPLQEFAQGKICRGIVSGLTEAFVITPQQRHEIVSKICMGIKSGLTEAFVITPQQRREIVSRNEEAKYIIRPFVQGRQIRRYAIEPVSQYLIYTHHGIDMKPYPAVLDHLRPFRDQLEQRATEQEWYELQQPQFAYVSYLEQPKIVFPDIATGCRFALDTKGRFGANTVYFIPTADQALLGLLNSRLAFFFFKQTCAALEGPGEAYLRFFGQYLEGFPVRLHAAPEKDRRRLAALAEQLESLGRDHAAATTDHLKIAIQRQIAVVEGQVDRLVYRLYELTADQIRIIEEVGIPVPESDSDELAERDAGDE